MRFTWKMIALVSLLLVTSMGVCGYAAISSAFDGRIEGELTAGQEDMRLFSLTLQALCDDELRTGDLDGTQRIVSNLALGNSSLSQREFRVCSEDGVVLFTTNSMIGEPREWDLEKNVVFLQVVEQGEQKYLWAAQKLHAYDTVLYLERCGDISGAFLEAEQDMKNYRIVMLCVLLTGVFVTTLICFYMTKPLRGITRTAKQFASGNYDKRVKEKSSDEVGQLILTFNVMADALEQKINELALAAQKQKDFTASFAHELKTPLTSVIGYADTLRSRGLSTEQQFRAADYIFSEGRRLEAMSHALLELFALEEQTPEFCNVSIISLASELERSLAYILKEKQLRLTVKMEKASLYIVPELIKTLLYNLIDNARKASKDGGEIILKGRMTEPGYRICVEDQGSGIPHHAIERITEPFYMVDKSRSRAWGGAGLGLALCQKIAELHGTALSFTSTEGKGTAVTFYLKGGEL